MPLAEVLARHGFKPAHECKCKHKIIGTGAVFYQSIGLLECTVCRGFQLIRKPID